MEQRPIKVLATMSHKPLMQYPNVDCPECDGTGYVHYECSMCEGSGRVGVVEAAEWHGAEFEFVAQRLGMPSSLWQVQRTETRVIGLCSTKEACAIKYLEWLKNE